MSSLGNITARLARGCIALLGAFLSTYAQADVYVAVDAQGVTLYASSPLGPEYQLLIKEPVAVAGGTLASAVRINAVQVQRRAAMRPLIERKAAEHVIAPALVEAVIQVESRFNAQAVSPKGALGVMQLMPATARRYGVTAQELRNNPERNLDAGIRHLKDLIAQHKGNLVLALAAYNAGAGAVDRHGRRIPPYRETMLYVPAVLAQLPATLTSTASTNQ